MKWNVDDHRRDLEFAVGDNVLLSSINIKLEAVGTKKLLPKFLGPFTVLKRIGKLAYKLDLSRDMPRVHPVTTSTLHTWYHTSSANTRCY
jgi:hypothetical protein